MPENEQERRNEAEGPKGLKDELGLAPPPRGPRSASWRVPLALVVGALILIAFIAAAVL
jgi:hypothetical protein